MKVRIKVRPSGLYNGKPWPEVGKVIDLPDHVATGMLNSKLVEPLRSGPKIETATTPDKSEKATTQRKDAKQAASGQTPTGDKPSGDTPAAGADDGKSPAASKE